MRSCVRTFLYACTSIRFVCAKVPTCARAVRLHFATLCSQMPVCRSICACIRQQVHLPVNTLDQCFPVCDVIFGEQFPKPHGRTGTIRLPNRRSTPSGTRSLHQHYAQVLTPRHPPAPLPKFEKRGGYVQRTRRPHQASLSFNWFPASCFFFFGCSAPSALAFFDWSFDFSKAST